MGAQSAHRLANHRAGDSIGLGEIPFGRQNTILPKLPGEDYCLHILEDGRNHIGALDDGDTPRSAQLTAEFMFFCRR